MKLPGKYIDGEYHYKSKIDLTKNIEKQVNEVIKEAELVRKSKHMKTIIEDKK